MKNEDRNVSQRFVLHSLGWSVQVRAWPMSVESADEHQKWNELVRLFAVSEAQIDILNRART
jgi:hypothetical protein